MKIDKKLTQPILDWCLKEENIAIMMDPGFHEGFVRGIPNINVMHIALVKRNFPFAEIVEIEKILLNKYKFKDFYRDSKFGIMVSLSKEGHAVHKHTDDSPREEDTCVRLNLLLQKPEIGGEAIIDNEVIDAQENEPWICLAGKYEHSSVKVEGDRHRIMLSYGYHVNIKEINQSEWVKK